MATPAYVPDRPGVGTRRPDQVDVGPARPPLPRPAEVGVRRPHPPGFGAPCPDGGFALRLASGRPLVLADGEHPADAVAVVAAVGLRRASLLGRAPVLHDIDVGRVLLGYDKPSSRALVRWRRRHLVGAEREAAVGQYVADAIELTVDLVRGPQVDDVERWQAMLIDDGSPRAASLAVLLENLPGQLHS